MRSKCAVGIVGVSVKLSVLVLAPNEVVPNTLFCGDVLVAVGIKSSGGSAAGSRGGFVSHVSDFHIRTEESAGKANHAGTFFGTDVNVANVADKPAAAPRRAAASQLDVNGNKYVEGENGVWHNLVWRQDEHAKFDTHTYNADATVASHNAIENPTITVKYVPGSHTNALMMITGNNVTTGVEGITNDADGGEAVYFNMQGLRVNEPQKGGVYVRIQNGKAVKITK